MLDGGDTSNRIGAGVFAPVVQARDIGKITLQLPAQVPMALAGLPPGSVAFAGRDDEIRTLLGCLAPPDTRDTVGKTELVVQAIRAAVARGWFPGGVLFVDMFGYDSLHRSRRQARPTCTTCANSSPRVLHPSTAAPITMIADEPETNDP